MERSVIRVFACRWTVPDCAALHPGYGLRTSRRLFRELALTQEAAEQLALALARDQVDVADEFCAALAALQHDLAAVEGFQLGAMRDADDGSFRQLLGDRLHHLVLALLVKRRGRLVQHDDVGTVQQEPSEGEALLLAAGQRLVPRSLLLDLLLEMIEADLVQGLADL